MPYLFVFQSGMQVLHEYDDQSHAITNVGLTSCQQNATSRQARPPRL